MTVKSPKTIHDLKVVTDISDVENQIQQNGIDLKADMIFQVSTDKTCILTEETRVRPESIKVEVTEYKGEKGFMLKAGCLYDVLFKESVKIPLNLSGMIIQRSSLNRMGAFITTGWWDSGFENRIGAIVRPWIDIFIGEGTRMAQIILFDSEAASEYNGIYKSKK